MATIKRYVNEQDKVKDCVVSFRLSNGIICYIADPFIPICLKDSSKVTVKEFERTAKLYAKKGAQMVMKRILNGTLLENFLKDTNIRYVSLQWRRISDIKRYSYIVNNERIINISSLH